MCASSDFLVAAVNTGSCHVECVVGTLCGIGSETSLLIPRKVALLIFSDKKTVPSFCLSLLIFSGLCEMEDRKLPPSPVCCGGHVPLSSHDFSFFLHNGKSLGKRFMWGRVYYTLNSIFGFFFLYRPLKGTAVLIMLFCLYVYWGIFRYIGVYFVELGVRNYEL